MHRLALAAFLIATPAAAQHVPKMSGEEVSNYLDKGQELETRVDGDVNLDGEIDTVFVGRSEEKRSLTVMLAVKSEVELGHQPVGTLTLDPYPLGRASVSMAKGVLKIEDLTGGTTAISAVYRYRLVPGDEPKMRLIGLEATLYSRTYQHDGFELSWNLLTGDLLTREMKLNKSGGRAAYDKVAEKKSKRPSKPLFMETTPNPEDLIKAMR
jgi:hypothetical protein